MKGIILAGGEGSRMSPLTLTKPKPLIPIINEPVISTSIQFLIAQGVTEIAITVHKHAEQIEQWCGDGSNYGVKIVYVRETQPLGTAGGLSQLKSFADETLIVISADVVCHFNLQDAVCFHQQKNSPFTLITTSVNSPGSYGTVIHTRDGKVIHFIEKPHGHQVYTNQVNTGIYLIEPWVLSLIPKDTAFDFSHDLFPMLLANNISFYCKELKGYWMDIGQLDTYLRTHHDLLNMGIPKSVPGLKEIRKGVWVGEGTIIEPSSMIMPPVVIGNGCHIGEDTKISAASVIGNGSRIGARCEIEQSLIWDDVIVGPECKISESIIASKSTIGARSSIVDKSVVAEHVNIGTGCLIGHHAYLDPGRKLASDSIIIQKEIRRKSINVPSTRVDVTQTTCFTHTFIHCHKELKLDLLRHLIEECLLEGKKMCFGDFIKIVEADQQMISILPYGYENGVIIYTHAESMNECLQLAERYKNLFTLYQGVKHESAVGCSEKEKASWNH